jgi:DMSO/TMAO reductase YedYZ molybdopterin-dependent catalytic subunit
MPPVSFLDEHLELSRRFFLGAGVAGLAGLQLAGRSAFAQPDKPLAPTTPATPPTPVKPKRVKPDKAGIRREPYFTPTEDFRDVSRGTPLPHSLPEDRQREVGLTRETWRLELLSDPEHPAKLGREFRLADGTAFDFAALLKLAETRTVRFAKVMTCLNLGCPLGMGLWEGVPLRDVVWLTKPRENVRRVFFHGYHNDDPKQLFRSSLPLSRVLEDPTGLPPVILCHKLNGQWLDAERGGPVRIVVPEAYGFKSIKWLTRLTLTNLAYANDTYADQNNDIDSPMKTFAATIVVPRETKAGEPVSVSGYAQVGVSGLSKVQVCAVPKDAPLADDDPYLTKLPWTDATILPAPEMWSGLPDGRVPPGTHGFGEDGRPGQWPMPLTNAHWAAIFPALPVGDYTFRSRTVDASGHAQPLPRPFRKSGHAAIEAVDFRVV